ncbi:hypothetical protein CEXT_36951 [Caerostris extrusa]|uniref:Uncharacterized protein n=1 Tax=Caerostris extrusa TaxID=172846 RepID=A0AAV4ULM8_CAEEX|nr:hypothetical protein CEXT_36951 [Caerostris extrusa]
MKRNVRHQPELATNYDYESIEILKHAKIYFSHDHNEITIKDLSKDTTDIEDGIEGCYYSRYSRSLMLNKRKRIEDMNNPKPNRCLGVIWPKFIYSRERELRSFGKYFFIEDVQVAYDGQSDRSGRFVFVYFEHPNDSKMVKN